MKAPKSLLLCAALLVPVSACIAQAQVTALPGYSVSVFAKGVANQFSAPDSIAITRDRVYIGYGDGNAPDGSDGKSNQIVEYDKNGAQLYVYTVKGHNDGLKVDPSTGKLWAMQNEDATPNLVIIDPRTHDQDVFKFSAPPQGGGYDDIVFLKGSVYFSASNPANDPNNKPAIVRATRVEDGVIDVEPVIFGNAKAISVVDNSSVTLNLQDPDSMTTDPSGDIVLDSQGDSELIIVRHARTDAQSLLQIPLSSPNGTPQIDDTLFLPVGDGFVLVSDTPKNTVYAIRKAGFVPGTALSAGVGANSVGFVGRLDLNTGYLTPVVTGLTSPHGLGYFFANPVDYDRSLTACSRPLEDKR